MKRGHLIATITTAALLAGGGAAAAASTHHADATTPHVTYRIDNAACNALREGYRADDVISWLQSQYGQSAYAASAVTVHAVDRGCGR